MPLEHLEGPSLPPVPVLRPLSFLDSALCFSHESNDTEPLDDASLPPLMWFCETELDIALSIFVILSSLSFYLSLLNVTFPSPYRDSA